MPVIDDFNDASAEEYVTATGSTYDKSRLQWESTNTFEGDYAMRNELGDWLCVISHPDNTNLTSYLPTYPSIGDTVVWYFWSGSGGGARLQFGVQGTDNRDNCYNCRCVPRDNEFRMQVREGGTDIQNIGLSSGVSWPADTWCRIEITWADDGTGTSELSATATNTETEAEIASIGPAVVDLNYTSGGIGWGFWGTSGSVKIVDNTHIPESGETITLTGSTTGNGTSTVTPTRARENSAGVSGSGGLSASSVRSVGQSTATTTTATATATPTQSIGASGVVSGTGAIAAQPTLASVLGSSLSGTGTADATLTDVYTGTVSVSGTAQLDDGTLLEGATIRGINDTTDTEEAVVTTDANGDYTIEFPSGDEAHFLFEYDVDGTQYQAESQPLIVPE